jgi:phospholipid/cholesterol/gamma-HCH transport system substrate-binding protein
MTSTDNSLGLLLNDRGIYDGLNRTINSADSLLIDMKARPGRYIHFSVFGKKQK